MELGDVIDKYLGIIGTSNTMVLYNKFNLKCQQKNKFYDTHEQYANVADRYMSMMIHKLGITNQDVLILTNDDYLKKR